MRHVQNVGLGYGDKELRGKVSVSRCYQPVERLIKRFAHLWPSSIKKTGKTSMEFKWGKREATA